MENLDPEKHPWTPENFNYVAARRLFQNPVVNKAEDLLIDFTEPDVEGLKEFLVKEKLFSEERVSRGIQKLMDARKTKTQGRLDTFFKTAHKISSTPFGGEDEKKNKRTTKASLPSGKLVKKGHAGGKKGVAKN